MSWQPVHDELTRWRAQGIAPSLWLRDDDAIEPTTSLDRFIGLTAQHQMSFVLAIIPAKTGEALACRLEGAPYVLPAVHGWSHANHAPEGEKRAELGPHRDIAEVLSDCARGLARLHELYGARLLPMLVPPWNRIGASVAAGLPRLGFRALSAFGRGQPVVSGLTIRNAQVDLIDWHGTRKCRDTGFLADWLAAELRHARELGRRDCGVLSHHLVDAPGQLAFLEELFAETPGLWGPPSLTPP
jgi:hypothetical protein